MRAFLGLGSNLGDRLGHLRRAVADLPDVTAVSPVYETEPIGPPGQDDYLNIVVELETELSPQELLAAARHLEAAARRVRTQHHGPRTLDVDVLLVGDLAVDSPELVVPHPRMWSAPSCWPRWPIWPRSSSRPSAWLPLVERFGAPNWEPST